MKTILILISAFQLFSFSAFGAAITVTASNLSLSAPWGYVVDANNTPEGSWSIDGVGQASATVTVPLGETLPAGNYSVFAKVLDFDHSDTLTYTIGGTTSGSQVLDDRDTAGIYWTTNRPAHAASSFSSLTLNFTFVGAFATQLRLIAVYITDNTNQVVLRDDQAMTFLFNGNTNAAVTKGNLIPNSSFEAGVSRFWRVITSAQPGNPTRRYSLGDCLVTNDGFHGQQSIRLGLDTNTFFWIESNPILCGSNRVHSFSCYAKSSSGNTDVGLRVISMYTAPNGATATLSTNLPGGQTVGTSWTRIGFSNIFIPWYPNGQVYLTIESRLNAGAFTYIDAIQFEEGDSTAYAPMNTFEAGPTLSERTQIVYTNDSSAFVKLRAFNTAASTATKRVDYSLYNWTNGLSLTGSVTLTATSSNFASTNLTIPVSQKGHFRLRTSITNQNSDDELAWIVVAPQASTAADTNSYFGAHINNDTNTMWRAQRLGAKHRRLFSADGLRWRSIETSSNVFEWPTITNDAAHGLTLLGQLGEDTPLFISPASGNTNHYWRYVSNAVVHYTNVINSWEIWNEPDQDGSDVPNLAHYAELVKQGSLAIKSIDPRLQVVAGGGLANYNMVTNLWALLGTATSRVDVISVHFYPPNESGAEAMSAFHAVPVWNTETGTTDKGGYTFANAPIRTAGTYLLPWKSADTIYDTLYGNVIDQARNLITCLAWGLKRQYYYDGAQRNIEVYNFADRQFSWMDYDDSIRAKGATEAGIFSLLDKCTGLGSLMFSNLPCYAFSVNGTPTVALWANSNMTAVLANTVNPSDLIIYDVMGNARVPSTLTLNFGRMPTIVQNIGSVTFEQAFSAFSNALVTARADLSAPQLAVQSPRAHGPIDYFRWFALDDMGIPNEDNDTRLQYRYAVNGAAYSAWSGNTVLEYIGASLPALTVQVRDAAGNITTIGDEILIDPGSGSGATTGPGRPKGKGKLKRR